MNKKFYLIILLISFVYLNFFLGKKNKKYMNKKFYLIILLISLLISLFFVGLNNSLNFITLNNFFFENKLFFSDENLQVNTEIVARRVGSGLATAGLGGVGTGIGLVFSGLIKGFSRNPSLKDELFSYAIFGFALTEAIGLFALMMAFMLLYA